MTSSKYINKQYRKNLIIVVFSQIFSGLGLSAGISVGAILAREILGNDEFSGVPSMIFTIGSAAFAYIIGTLTNIYGRRIGLSTGFLMGSIGAIGVVISYSVNNIYIMLISLFLYGSGAATNLLSRYASTDLSPNNKKGKSISITLVFTTVGVLLGPYLLHFINFYSSKFGVHEELSPFILASIGYGISFLIIIIFMRPDPLKLALKLRSSNQKNLNHNSTTNIDKNSLWTSALIMIVVQIIMISIMTMTPLHMKDHRHHLSDINLVIGVHIASMFLPSLFTGVLVDKLGTRIMIIFSNITFIIASIIAAFSSGESLISMLLSLTLLGIAWNMGFISGTTMLIDATDIQNRAKIQGEVDIFIALAGALSSGLSGYLVLVFGFYKFALIFGALSLILIPLSVKYLFKVKRYL
ncbi:MFS transporter [Staphylococcus gallinarum]|uniref:MFS transporter n=1 Tax=Staphylococcus gallinarum TaxID=1293 RepID=UPI0030BECB88